MEWKTHRETVTFLNGKSVSRMKSFFRAVKCFFLSEPFAPQVDLCCPSLRGLARVHERCKWITNKKHFRQGKMISRGNLLQVENGTLFNDNRNYEFFECFSCWKNDFSLYLVTAWKKNHQAWKKNHLAWKKNHFSFISDRKIIFLSRCR